MVHWVYVIECSDKFIYVGETEYLYKRLSQHIQGRGGKNTHIHIPKTLIGLYKVNDNYSFYKYNLAKKNNEYTNFIIKDWGISGDNLMIENRITERLFYERRNNKEYGSGNEWYRVRGGKYVKEELDEIYYSYKWASEGEGRGFHASIPIYKLKEETIVDRPLCKCGMPSEVKINKDKTKIYFVCAMNNVWKDFYKGINVNQPCDFWKLHTELNISNTDSTKCMIIDDST